MYKRTPDYDPADHMLRPEDAFLTRRELLQRAGMGMGALSLGMILNNIAGGSMASAATTGGPLMPKNAPLPAKAKHVIHIFAGGGPSHVDTWDPKPALAKYADQPLPGLGGLAYASPFKFEKKGKSGIEVSEVFPELGNCIDDMCVVRSLYTDVPDHGIASRYMHTGSLQLPKPSIGSWVLYGLGTENQNLPGFISLGGGAEDRQASFLPSLFQGVNVDYSRGMPLDKVLLNLRSQFVNPKDQQVQIQLARQLNGLYSEKLHKDEQLETRIESFEMAFKMQAEAMDAFDVSKEPEAVKKMYGDSDMGSKLMVARRLVERGVRFVQVEAGGWDHHANLEVALRRQAGSIDGPAAALLKDLKQRGLLKDTLVIWGGEFGRTVTADTGAATPGRNHNGQAFCCWMAGGGVKGGTTYGATDEFGARAEVNRVGVHDLHATILRAPGLRSHQAHLPLQRPRFPSDRQLRQGDQRHHCLI